MCGRTCLTLHPEQILCATKYELIKIEQNYLFEKNSPEAKKAYNNTLIPEWRSEYNCGRMYEPSHNIAPTDITPVLISGDHFEENPDVKCGGTRVLIPMMWGMIPFWHKGDYRKHGLTTNNCRLEHLLESKMFRGPFRKGQRCVVLCEGFYEWQTTKSAKPSERSPHFIYMRQKEGAKIYDKSTWTPENVKLLKLAGLFDVWEDENGDKMYSYSVITFQSSKILSWLHHRMPAVLETEEQVNNWLNFRSVSEEQALSALLPAKNLEWHQVTKLVNNSRNKSDECNKPVDVCKLKQITKNKIMRSWLVVRNHPKDIEKTIQNSDDEESDGGLCDNSKVSAVNTATSSSIESDEENVAKRRKINFFQRQK